MGTAESGNANVTLFGYILEGFMQSSRQEADG